MHPGALAHPAGDADVEQEQEPLVCWAQTLELDTEVCWGALEAAAAHASQGEPDEPPFFDALAAPPFPAGVAAEGRSTDVTELPVMACGREGQPVGAPQGSSPLPLSPPLADLTAATDGDPPEVPNGAVVAAAMAEQGGSSAVLCEFSELLDSFAAFLDGEMDLGARHAVEAGPQQSGAGFVGATSPANKSSPLSSLPSSEPETLCSPAAGPLGHSLGGNLSSSTSSSSHCAATDAIAPGLAASQSEGAISSNSQSSTSSHSHSQSTGNRRSSSSTSSGGSSKARAVEKGEGESCGAAGRPTLLAKLKDLCRNSGSTPSPARSGASLVPSEQNLTGTAAPDSAEPGLVVAVATPSATPSQQGIPMAPMQQLLHAPSAPLHAPAPSAKRAGSGQVFRGCVLPVSQSHCSPGNAYGGCLQQQLGSGTPTAGQVKQHSEGSGDVGKPCTLGGDTLAVASRPVVGEGLLQKCEGKVGGPGSEEEGEEEDEDATDLEHEGAPDAEERMRQQRLMRNRQSALQSRQRRKLYMQELEQRCRVLESQVGHMKQIVAMTALENGALRDEVSRLQQLLCQQPTQAGGPERSIRGASRSPSASLDASGPQRLLHAPASQPEKQVMEGKGQNLPVPHAAPCAGSARGVESGHGGGQPRGNQKATSLGAEPAALKSDSLPSESLLPYQRQLLGVLFSLHLSVMMAALQAVVASALHMPFLNSFFQCLLHSAPCPGPYLGCLLPPSGALVPREGREGPTTFLQGTTGGMCKGRPGACLLPQPGKHPPLQIPQAHQAIWLE